MSKYYYAKDNERFGPYSLDELTNKEITKETLIWYKGLPEWITASEVDELQTLFEDVPPALPNTVKEENLTSCQDKTSNYLHNKASTDPFFGQIPPKNWLIQALLATIFCCLPFGIVALIYSSQVEKKFYLKDYIGAEKASKNAKTWIILSVVFAAIGILIWILFLVLLTPSNSYDYYDSTYM